MAALLSTNPPQLPQAESIPDISVEQPSDAQQDLKRKLKNIAGMWQPVTASVAESGEHSGSHYVSHLYTLAECG